MTARDLGLGRMMSTKKDYIGRVMAQRPALLDRTGRRWSASGRSIAPRGCARGRISSARRGGDRGATTKAT